MKSICPVYLPAFYRSFGSNAINVVSGLLVNLKQVRYDGVWLIAPWEDGGADNGFDVKNYRVNPKFGTERDLDRLIEEAHRLGMTVGIDVVPNHVSIDNPLAQACIKGVEGFEDALYVVSDMEGLELIRKGVPSFFGSLAFSPLGDGRSVFTPFADYKQPANNFANEEVQQYYANLFRSLKLRGIDFVRVDCGMMLLPDFSKADKNNPMAIFDPKRSIQAVRAVADDMLLFFEWFDPATAYLFDDDPLSYALDCSYVLDPHPAMNWNHPKLVPLLGGHDQMTPADRGYDIDALLARMSQSEYGFYDLATLLHWTTDPRVLPGDVDYDADLNNFNQRYRARRPVLPMLVTFLTRRQSLTI